MRLIYRGRHEKAEKTIDKHIKKNKLQSFASTIDKAHIKMADDLKSGQIQWFRIISENRTNYRVLQVQSIRHPGLSQKVVVAAVAGVGRCRQYMLVKVASIFILINFEHRNEDLDLVM